MAGAVHSHDVVHLHPNMSTGLSGRPGGSLTGVREGEGRGGEGRGSSRTWTRLSRCERRWQRANPSRRYATANTARAHTHTDAHTDTHTRTETAAGRRPPPPATEPHCRRVAAAAVAVIFPLSPPRGADLATERGRRRRSRVTRGSPHRDPAGHRQRSPLVAHRPPGGIQPAGGGGGGRRSAPARCRPPAGRSVWPAGRKAELWPCMATGGGGGAAAEKCLFPCRDCRSEAPRRTDVTAGESAERGERGRGGTGDRPANKQVRYRSG